MTSCSGAFRPRVCGEVARIAGFDEVEVDGHPRILVVLRAAG
jgi:hypothetical protein